MVHLSLALFASAAIASPLVARQSDCEHCEDEAHGFASLNGGTTGGKGGEIVIATTHEELKEYAASEGPLIIRVEGEIVSDPVGYEIPIASNKTIIGMGEDAKLIGGGFHIENSQNIILRNMQVSDTADPDQWEGKEGDFDGLQVDTGSNIWVDHMTVSIFTECTLGTMG